MDPIEIGDAWLEPVEGSRVRVTNTEEQPSFTWTVAGARAAIAWLQRWCEMEEPRVAAHPCPWCEALCTCTNDFACRHCCPDGQGSVA